MNFKGTRVALGIAMLFAGEASAQLSLRRQVACAASGYVENAGTTLFYSLGQSTVGSFSSTSLSVNAGFWHDGVRHCPADVDDGAGAGTPDGGVTIDDLLFYVDIFELGITRADLDDGSGTGTPDGGVTIDDLLYFLFRFEQGC